MFEELRILRDSDIPQLISKIKESETFYLANSNKASTTKDEYLNYTLGLFVKDNHIIHGHFADGVLTSIMASQELKSLPAFVLKNYKNFNPSNFFRPDKNGWIMLYTGVIEHYESKGIYTYYAMQTAKDIRNINMRKHVKKVVDNYDITIEEFVPANTLSKYDLHSKTMYYGKTMPVDTIVNRYSCKQEFRKPLLP